MPILSAQAAAAICQHMNEDHADAIADYARAYADLAGVTAAQIVAFDGQGMNLAVECGTERTTAHIAFDHELRDSDDARATLIAMAKHAAGA